MFIIINLLFILAYMFNDYIGFALMGIYTFYIIFLKKDKLENKIMRLIISSLPLSYIGILGKNMHQMISWYNLFLIFLIFAIFKNKKELPKQNLVLFSIYLLLVVLTVIASEAISINFIELIQLMLMIFPLFLFLDKNRKIFNEKEDKENLCMYSDVCVSTAISMIIQYFLFYFVNIKIGFFNISANRISCFCLFKGASILPIFMGIGFLLIFINMLTSKFSIIDLLKIIIIFIAVVLNTSRSALLVLLIVTLIIIFKKVIKKIDIKTVFLLIIMIIGMYFGINYILNLRTGLTSFLDDNGRYESWINGINIWKSSFKNILIGEGFTGGLWEGVVKTHNMLIQTLAQCGLISTIILLFGILKFLKINKKNKFKYVLYFIIISYMLVTDFYANPYATVAFIIITEYSKNGEKRYEKS